MYYLWFIGVSPADQGKGAGSKLLGEIMLHAQALNRPVYLETSSEKNVSWYTHAGFEMYRRLDFGYDLFMLRKKNDL